MKIIITTFITLISLAGFNQDIEKAFEPKSSTVSIGYGTVNYVGLHYLKESKKDNSLNFNSIGSFHGKYEYQLNTNTSIGANFAYKSIEVSSNNYFINDIVGYKDFTFFDTWSINLRLNKFFAMSKNSTFYYGIGLGYRSYLDATFYKDSTNNFEGEIKENRFNNGLSKLIYQSPIEIEATIGYRYKFTKNIGVYGEVGLAKGFIQGGVFFNTTNKTKNVNDEPKPKKEFEAFGNNAHVFSGGIGLASYYAFNSNNITELTPALNIKYEYGASEEFGFGLNFAYYESTLNETYNTKVSNYNYVRKTYLTDTTFSNYYGTLSLILRLNYHPIISNKVDVYFGGGIGYRYGYEGKFDSYDYKGYPSDFFTKFPVAFELTAGFRYYPIKHIGIYVEAGLAKSLLQSGIVFKL